MKDTIIDAALGMCADGLEVCTIENVARVTGLTEDEVRRAVPSDQELKLEVILAINMQPVERIDAAVSAAKTPEEAVHGFLEGFVSGHDLAQFRACFLNQLDGWVPFTPEQMGRLYPINDLLFSRLAAKLQAYWGGDELLHGIHPRRLVFAGYLGALGLMLMKSITQLNDDTLKHTDDELVAELSRALAAPTTMMTQLVDLHEASAAIASARTEAEVLERVPLLIVEKLGFRSGELHLGVTRPAGELVVEVPKLGWLSAEPRGDIDRRDTTRLAMFANMVSLALDNARFYESLSALVEQRTAELRQAQAALVQSEKMAAMGQLVAGVAHELNTPLGALQSAQGSLATAAQRIEDTLREKAPALIDEDRKLRNALRVVKGSTSVVESGTERVGQVVDRLERFARLDRAERATADIHQCIEDALAALPPSAADITIERRFAEVAPMLCWPAKLNQLFLIVFTNAVQAMPEGGALTVETAATATELRVSVRDSGKGIEAENLQRIFDPGFTTRGVGVGTGLGLSIAYQIVTEHGGTIVAESELGEGTVLHIAFPL